jgi:hypothetical protein
MSRGAGAVLQMRHLRYCLGISAKKKFDPCFAWPGGAKREVSPRRTNILQQSDGEDLDARLQLEEKPGLWYFLVCEKASGWNPPQENAC